MLHRVWRVFPTSSRRCFPVARILRLGTKLFNLLVIRVGYGTASSSAVDNGALNLTEDSPGQERTASLTTKVGSSCATAAVAHLVEFRSCHTLPGRAASYLAALDLAASSPAGWRTNLLSKSLQADIDVGVTIALSLSQLPFPSRLGEWAIRSPECGVGSAPFIVDRRAAKGSDACNISHPQASFPLQFLLCSSSSEMQ